MRPETEDEFGINATVMDVVSSEVRSQMMAAVRGKNSIPELTVRSIVHRLGLRFRLHRRDLAGTPDLVFPGRGAVIFVHGCFWHQHKCAKGGIPKTRRKFWQTKLNANRARDLRANRLLRKQGWRVLTIWECEIKKPDIVRQRIIRFFNILQQ